VLATLKIAKNERRLLCCILLQISASSLKKPRSVYDFAILQNVPLLSNFPRYYVSSKDWKIKSVWRSKINIRRVLLSIIKLSVIIELPTILMGSVKLGRIKSK